MDWTHTIHDHFNRFGTSSYFGPIHLVRVDQLPKQLHWIHVLVLTLFGIPPNLLIMYILKRYNFTRIKSYAIICDYMLMSSVIILATCLDLFIKRKYTLVPDFVSLMSPVHTILVLNMINPNFNVDYVNYSVSFISKLATSVVLLTYLIVVNHLSSAIILLARMFLVFVNVLVVLAIITYIIADVYLKMRDRHLPGELDFWEVLHKGGFPRYEIALIHCFHWVIYWCVSFFSDVYFAYALLFAYLSGLVCLMSLLSHNEYFNNSCTHAFSCKKVTSEDMLPDDCHTRYTLESLHVYSDRL